MWKFGLLVAIILPFVFFDWYSRRIFLAVGYPRRYGHGKSWNRAYKHYKTNWSFWERMFWVFVFKEKYETKFRIQAYLSYIHFALTVIVTCIFLVSLKFFPDLTFWKYSFFVDVGFLIVREFYDEGIVLQHKKHTYKSKNNNE